MEHAFFVIMGGFQLSCQAPCTQLGLHQSSLKIQAGGVVTSRGFKILLNHEAYIIPDVSIEEVRDKSKASSLAKALLIWQVLWFCMAGLTRLVQHLPLSLFEVMTFAHGVCTLMACFLWWSKPKDVNEHIVISGGESFVGKMAIAGTTSITRPEFALPRFNVFSREDVSGGQLDLDTYQAFELCADLSMKNHCHQARLIH